MAAGYMLEEIHDVGRETAASDVGNFAVNRVRGNCDRFGNYGVDRVRRGG